jgi:hypothetical protein
LASSWIRRITPLWFILPLCTFSPIVFQCVYLSFIFLILALLHWLQHWYERDSADAAYMNTWKGSYAYNITLLITYLAAACWYNEQSVRYMSPSSRFIPFEDSVLSSIAITLSMTPCISAITHQVLPVLNWALNQCHAVTSNDVAFMGNYYV